MRMSSDMKKSTLSGRLRLAAAAALLAVAVFGRGAFWAAFWAAAGIAAASVAPAAWVRKLRRVVVLVSSLFIAEGPYMAHQVCAGKAEGPYPLRLRRLGRYSGSSTLFAGDLAAFAQASRPWRA